MKIKYNSYFNTNYNKIKWWILLKRTKKFIINGFILTITALITRSISMVFNIYVSNKIGSEAVGVFSLVMSVH